jgi:DNA-binding response OmpR family regulator
MRDKKKILIVDDEEQLVMLLTARLSANNYNVVAAYDGVQALEKVRTEKPDLIVLDIMLPKMDGYKVCRLLKFDARHKHVPILIFSARAQESDKTMAFEVGADDYIVKPFEPETFLSKVKALLDK